MADHSFDIASKIEAQEIDNAVNQAMRDINNRYDLKNSKSTIEFQRNDHKLILTAPDDYKIKAVYDILRQKLVTRKISLKGLEAKDIEQAAGSTVKQEINIQQGIPMEKAKQIVKDIKGEKMKVQAQIQKDQVRISSKKIDDLQNVIQFIKEQKYDIDIQFLNLR
mgnify:CR=1 FL=1|jgi:cyclic-di-GMP-binding protein